MITVEFTLADLPDGVDLDIEEDRGRVVYRVGRHLTPEQIMGVLNRGAEAVIAGGHWFQEWKGDIVAVDEAECRPRRRVPPQRPELRDVNRPDNAA